MTFLDKVWTKVLGKQCVIPDHSKLTKRFEEKSRRTRYDRRGNIQCLWRWRESCECEVEISPVKKWYGMPWNLSRRTLHGAWDNDGKGFQQLVYPCTSDEIGAQCRPTVGKMEAAWNLCLWLRRRKWMPYCIWRRKKIWGRRIFGERQMDGTLRN